MLKKYCLATITSNDFCVGTEVLLHSFLKYNTWFKGDINIVIADLSTICRQRLEAIYPVNFVPASGELIKKIEILRTHFNYLRDIHLRFYSLEIFNMTTYDKVVYLDSDMYCAGDIQELFLLEHPLAACLDGFSYKTRLRPIMQQARLTLTTKRERYGKQFDDSFNSGILVVGPPILSKHHYKALVNMLDYEAWLTLGKSIFTDQMVINRYFEGQFSIISSQYNYMVFLAGYLNYVDKVSFQDAKIIHFAGSIKPWNNYNTREIVEKAPHYLKFIEVWRELLAETRYVNDLEYHTKKLVEQIEWIKNNKNNQLFVKNRIY